MSSEESNILIHRRYSEDEKSYRYTHVASGLSVGQAKREVTRTRCEPNDLLIICKERYMYEFADKAKFIYIADDSGKPRLPPLMHTSLVSHGYISWLNAWEGSDASADAMIYPAYISLDRMLVVRVLCMVARTAMQYIPSNENTPLLAIESVESWMRGEANIKDVEMARYKAKEAYAQYSGYRLLEAINATVSLTSIIASPSYGANTELAFVQNTIFHAARASRLNLIDSLHELSSIVREVIPLEVMIKAYKS